MVGLIKAPKLLQILERAPYPAWAAHTSGFPPPEASPDFPGYCHLSHPHGLPTLVGTSLQPQLMIPSPSVITYTYL